MFESLTIRTGVAIVEQLVTRAIAGDDRAFLQLMQIHRDVLYKTAFIYLKNEIDVMEALSEVTYRAYTKRHRVKEPAFFQTWLMRILLNYCMDVLKKQGRITPKSDIGDVPFEQDSIQFELDEALQILSSSQRELIHMKYFEELKTSDMAVKLQVPEGTIKSRLHHTLKKMRLFLSDRGGDVK